MILFFTWLKFMTYLDVQNIDISVHLSGWFVFGLSIFISPPSKKKKKSLRYKELLSVNETQRIITVQNSKGHKIIDIAVLKIIVD